MAPRIKREAAYDELRRNGTAAVVVLSAILAVLMAVVGLLVLSLAFGSHGTNSTPPLALIALLPFAIWAVKLANYAAGPVRWLRQTVIGAPIASMIWTAVAAWQGYDDLDVWFVLLGICLASAGVAITVYPRTPLPRAGRPDADNNVVARSAATKKQGSPSP